MGLLDVGCLGLPAVAPRGLYPTAPPPGTREALGFRAVLAVVDSRWLALAYSWLAVIDQSDSTDLSETPRESTSGFPIGSVNTPLQSTHPTASN